MDVKLQIIPEKPLRREILNLKNRKYQEIFKSNTTNTNEFTNCFENDLSLEIQIQNWRKILKKHCHRAFKKVRIKEKPQNKFLINKEISQLVNQRNRLLKTVQRDGDTVIKDIEKDISNREAEINRDFVRKQLKHFSGDQENINLSEMWKILKRINPKHKNTVPVAKKDYKGKLTDGHLVAKIYNVCK